MFTGLVEGLGIVAGVVPEPPGVRLEIEPPAEFLVGAPLGDSVAINGCCLTVVAALGRCWRFQAGPETLLRTNLGRLRAGDAVNLERALPVSGRLGGHFVQGHVDGVGEVVEVIPSGDWVTMRFRAPEPLTRQMVSKGSIAVDGVSLTLVDVGGESFSVALIPHTLNVTTLGRRRPGDIVNLETDILAKYVQKLLADGGANDTPSQPKA